MASDRLVKTVSVPSSRASQSMSADIDRALLQLNTEFNPFHKDFALDFHVSGAKNGYVYLSLALPEGMTRVFVQLLESMHGFFRCIDFKSRTAFAHAKSVDPAVIAETEELRNAFRLRCCSVFDDLRVRALM